MARLRLIVLALSFEFLITAVVSLGIYMGFSVYPYTQAVESMATTTNGSMTESITTIQYSAALPLYMPQLATLKIPYTLLQPMKQDWGMISILVSAAILVLQSFVRGMYLGGIKALVLLKKPVSLMACGRKYFRAMLAFSVVQVSAGLLSIFLAAIFFPIGFILMFILLFYSLIPYLIVLQNITFMEALSKAPRIFRKYFGKLLHLALFAMFCMLMVSFSKTLPTPFSYALPLLASAVVGTFLIIELMRTLQERLLMDNETIPQLDLKQVHKSSITILIHMILIPLLVAVSVLFASGQYLSIFDWGEKKRLEGVSYWSNFSTIDYSSEQRYVSYEWQIEESEISVNLPDLSNDQKPEEIRGIADITWQVDREVRTVYGNHTSIDVQPFKQQNKLMYRLVREISEDGSYYYSSLNGSASIIQGGERTNEPLSIHIMVSGDGENLFVLQYPTRFDSSQVFRVSSDGNYFIPRTSPINPGDFRTYWFREEQQVEGVFELLASKNKINRISSDEQIDTELAVALQEADGETVIEILNRLRKNEANVLAPDWDEQEWTNYLRRQYEGASLEKTIQFVTRAGTQFGYGSIELDEQGNDESSFYQIEVPFPKDNIIINYELSKKERRITSISLLN